MDTEVETIRHVLATLAYRTQKALRGADASFADFSAGNGIRTPIELIIHMSSVIGYARTFFIGVFSKLNLFHYFLMKLRDFTC